MKKILLITALSTVLAVPTFAQTKVVKQVERIVKSDKPNLKEARELISETLKNEETKEDPRAWFTAGEVERKEVEMQKIKMALNQNPNEEAMYEGLEAMYPYYLEAYRLDGMPNHRGKIKRKYDKEIKKALADNHGFYVNAGSYYLNNNNFPKAYDFFKIFMDIKELPMFEGTPIAEQDSLSMQIGFFKAYTRSQMGDHKGAIEEYEAIKSVPFRQSDVYQLLASEYTLTEDSVNFVKTIKEGAELFPNEKFFIFNLINQYIRSGKNEEAIEYLQIALEKEPNNVQLINVMGKVYEQGFKDMAKAEECFRKALEIDPTDSESTIDLGRIYFNKAVALQSESNNLDPQSPQAVENDKKAKELFRQALPYFEKATELEPDNTEYLMALRGIYYNLGDEAKVEELSKRLGLQ